MSNMNTNTKKEFIGNLVDSLNNENIKRINIIEKL